MRVALQVDIGVGDALVPSPEPALFPSIIGDQSPVVLAYRRELVVAEKLEAVVSLGGLNTRLKDFFDIWFLANHFDFDSMILSEAVRRTFDRRKTTMPSQRPLPLSDDFSDDDSKARQWSAFLGKANLVQDAPSLREVTRKIWEFAAPIFLSDGKTRRVWKASGPWRER